ncbi:hypothetical protein DIPPA_22037 [Diplonema papillatum]|nr:hypothetical protein DIPPA_22037 [Diplonema papillatum]|eukprot:gene12572-19471_t
MFGQWGGFEGPTACSSGATPLFAASGSGHTAVVRRLLAAGAGVEGRLPTTDRGNPGLTALLQACRNGHADVASILLRAGADANAVDGNTADTALLEACRNTDRPNVGAVIEVLLSGGANTEALDLRDRPALVLAVVVEALSIVWQLLDAGADPNWEGRSGRLLLIACDIGNADVVETLVRGGANVNAVDHREDFALMFATVRGDGKLVKRLLEVGANVNLTVANRTTALMQASGVGDDAIVGALLDAGADLEIEDGAGLTALSLAARNGHQNVVDRLLAAGAKLPECAGSDWRALQCFTPSGAELVD